MAPSGRSLVYSHTVAEMSAVLDQGQLSEGDVAGSCSPDCGSITLRRSASQANPGKWYCACGAAKGITHNSFVWVITHNSFVWVTQEETSGRRLFEEAQVPYCLAAGKSKSSSDHFSTS